MLKKRTALFAGATVVVVGTALVLWPEEERNARSGHAEPRLPDPMLKAPFPPLPAAEVEDITQPWLIPFRLPEEAPPRAVRRLHERKAVLDVVERTCTISTPSSASGIRAHPLSDVAPETPGMVAGFRSCRRGCWTRRS